jgi:membrane protein YqaA with SNARE-associated domain
MHKFFASIFGLFLSPVGLVVLAALDSSMVFFLPAAVEGAVVILTARYREFVWLFPILATAGSVAGAWVTFRIGSKIGEESLKFWLSEHRLKSMQKKIKEKGALALGAAGALPPPFPLSPFVLACGALHVRRTPFFLSFAIARVLRFGVIAVSALFYGNWILRVMESRTFQIGVTAFIVIAIVGTAFTIYQLKRSAGPHPGQSE